MQNGSLEKGKKLWIALCLFRLQFCVFNAFIVCCAMCTHVHNMTNKELWTYFDFQKYLVLSLTEPEGWGPDSENWRRHLNKKIIGAVC